MIQPRKVKASSMSATYDAGVYCTETDAEAIEQARERYRNSHTGQTFKDLGAFRFYIAGRGADAYTDD